MLVQTNPHSMKHPQDRFTRKQTVQAELQRQAQAAAVMVIPGGFRRWRGLILMGGKTW